MFGFRDSKKRKTVNNKDRTLNGRCMTNSANGKSHTSVSGKAVENMTKEPVSIIELRDISKAYKTTAGPFLALKNIELEIENGEFISIVGKSGSGKSTLINMLTGIDRPTDGDIYVAQTCINQLDEGKMAVWRGANMGIIFQFFQLLPTLTLVENVLIPMDFTRRYPVNERYDRAMHLLEMVDMAQNATRFPSAVSGGQQQKVAIARALANDPPILVADEPTGNLDSNSAGSVFDLFESLVDRGKTILMVTHDDDLARRAPRTITLADGEIVDEERRIAHSLSTGQSKNGTTSKLLAGSNPNAVNPL